MNSTFIRWAGRRGGAVPAGIAAVVAVLLIGFPTGSDRVGADASVPVSSSTSSWPLSQSGSSSVARGRPVTFQLDGQVIAARLADNPASRELEATLPMTVELDDRWGQAKSGRLPRPLPVASGQRTLRPAPGGIYYWPGTTALVVYYDDLGQSVPDPGLIFLGVVETGLERIAATERHITVRIDCAPDTGS